MAIGTNAWLGQGPWAWHGRETPLGQSSSTGSLRLGQSSSGGSLHRTVQSLSKTSLFSTSSDGPAVLPPQSNPTMRHERALAAPTWVIEQVIEFTSPDEFLDEDDKRWQGCCCIFHTGIFAGCTRAPGA
mmetsp:Transcript_8304/g.23064  ORF Transcript_8304/g.23064 Transcript_8304/m.23064 type:complete len:129 (-) Transcript_8304:265-651(-)